MRSTDETRAEELERRTNDCVCPGDPVCPPLPPLPPLPGPLPGPLQPN